MVGAGGAEITPTSSPIRITCWWRDIFLGPAVLNLAPRESRDVACSGSHWTGRGSQHWQAKRSGPHAPSGTTNRDTSVAVAAWPQDSLSSF